MNVALKDNTNSEDGDLIDEIIRMSDFSFERLPMLDIIGSRMADFLPVALSDLTRAVCEAELVEVDYIPLSQAIDGFPKPVLIALATSPMLEGQFVLAMDAPLVLSALELSLGGKASSEGINPSDVEFTSIERGFAKQLAELALVQFRQAFSVIGDIFPELNSVETNEDAAVVAQQASLCIVMKFEIRIGEQNCILQLILPYDTVEPIKPQLSKIHFGDRGDDVSPWHDIIKERIGATSVELEVVLTEQKMVVREIMQLQHGQVLDLMVGEDHESTVMCSGSALFKCVTGKRNNGLAAIRIVEEIEFPEESLDGCSTS